VVYYLTDVNEQVTSVILSVAFNTYLQANA
jgi:hypothetical protein